jgi:hypothetical protein
MAIRELRILPPLAIGRLGSSPEPLAAYELETSPSDQLEYRRIAPRRTLIVNPSTGAIASDATPPTIEFRDAEGRIRPVAPFLEVFARTGDDVLEPLTLDLLRQHGLRPADVRWTVAVGNIKAFRRTGFPEDRVYATLEAFSDHAAHELRGRCPNFKPEAWLPLGSVRYIRPTPRFPEIRLRFTPAHGLVYGASAQRQPDEGGSLQPDPVFEGHPERLIYADSPTATWRGYKEIGGPTVTNPGQIFAGYGSADGGQVSWGYLDDECDGVVTVTLTFHSGQALTARATLCAGPPTFAPDALPIRTVADELEQILLGPDVPDVAVSSDEAEEILRRALDTVRLLNTTVMNGNPVDGRVDVASTMVGQDTGDFRRYFEPIMAPSLVDTLAVQALHARVLSALRSGTAAWFADTLRRPDEIGDMSDAGRRKMPAMMRGADGRMLTLTRRQIALVVKASARAMFAGPTAPSGAASTADGSGLPETVVAPRNVTAQLHHRAAGNPVSTLPSTAISNCFPGLEFDFRNLWRRAFVGIVLLECGNLVVAAEDPQYQDLVNHRLLRVDGVPIVATVSGPTTPDGSSELLSTGDNPGAATAMEWSNALAHVLGRAGATVPCDFTADEAPGDVPIPEKSEQIRTVNLAVRPIFEGETAAFAPDVVRPGELTQGLCSPWQNDYRECACYYWAASRPDYVNVEPTGIATSRGDNWMQKKWTGEYVLDDLSDSRLVTYDDLFTKWETYLRFVVHGRVIDP